MDKSPAATKHHRAAVIRSLKALLANIELEGSRGAEFVWYEFWNEVLAERTRFYCNNSLILTIAPQYCMVREAFADEENANLGDADWSTTAIANESGAVESNKPPDSPYGGNALPLHFSSLDPRSIDVFAAGLEGVTEGIPRTSSPAAPNRTTESARLSGTSEFAIRKFMEEAYRIGVRHSKGELRQTIQDLKARFAEAKKAVIKEKRYPDFAAFVTMLGGLNVHWPFLIVEIKPLKFGGNPYVDISDISPQASTQAQFTFEAFPTLSSIFALLIAGPYWQLIKIRRADLDPLPKTKLTNDNNTVDHELVVEWESKVHFIFDGLDGDDYCPEFLDHWDTMMKTLGFISPKAQKTWVQPVHPVTALLMLLIGLLIGLASVMLYQAQVCQPDCSTVVDHLLRCMLSANNGPAL